MPTLEQILAVVANPPYTDLTAQQVAAAGNAKTIVTWHTVDKPVVLRRLIAADLWPKIEGLVMAPAGATSPNGTPLDQPLTASGITLRTAAASTKTYYTSAAEPVDAQDPKLVATVALFSATGVFTPDQVASFYAGFQTPISPFEELWGVGVEVTADQVAAARLLPKVAELQATRTGLETRWNRVVATCDAVQEQLAVGQDVELPAEAELVATFGA